MIRTVVLAAISFVPAALALADDPAPRAKPDEKPAAATAQQDPAKQDAKPAVAPADAELLKSLEKQLSPEPEEHPLVRVGSRMRDVQGRLVKADAGDETRGTQKAIIEDLDKLIEEMKKGGG